MNKLILAALAAGSLVVGAASPARADLLINGAGATFPAPLYTKWFAEYKKLHSEVAINYQAIGSGGGIKQITEKTVDFGASDAPMNAEELAKAPGLVHIPTVLGAVVITYNLPGVTGPIKLSGPTVADFFLGSIAKWNDPRLAKDNPGIKFPDLAVTVAHRSDGSGTTFVFTDYLAKVSPEFKTKVGVGKSVKFPVGLGGKGNDGVTGLVKSTPGAVGYVELAYANNQKLPVAEIKNKEGHFIKPDIEAISQSAAYATIPDDYRVSITDAPGKDSYPISAFTYLLVYQDQQDPAKGKDLIEFLWWAQHEGQKFAKPLDYAPLPKAVVEKVDKTIKAITIKGQKGPALK